MQIIHPVAVDAEEYVSSHFQRRIPSPTSCPHCSHVAALRALGYYERNLSGTTAGILRIQVRRFRCVHCGKTVSFLPAFAQPYRLLQNRIVHAFFCKQCHAIECERWYSLLRRYWNRFGRWLPELQKAVPFVGSRSPPATQTEIWWALLSNDLGDLMVMTMRMVSEFQITLFGRYRCHVPNRPMNEVT